MRNGNLPSLWIGGLALKELPRVNNLVLKLTAMAWGEMAQWLILQGTGVCFLAPVWQLRTICNSGSRGSDALFWPLWALHTDNILAYIHAGKTPIHINKQTNK